MQKLQPPADSRASPRRAPLTASTRTARRPLPPPNCCCARRASPPKSARAARRASSPASIGALCRARHCRSSPIGRRSRRLQHEFAAIGFYLSSHPLDPYGSSLERAGIIRWADLPAGLAANPTNRFRLAWHRDRPQGAHLRPRQPFCVCADVGPERHLRGGPVLGILSGGARAPRFRPAARRHGRMCAARKRASGSPRKRSSRSIRSSRSPPPACASLSSEARALSNLKSVIARESGGRGRVTVVLDSPPAKSKSQSRRLQGQPGHPRRRQIVARHHRRPRYLIHQSGFWADHLPAMALEEFAVFVVIGRAVFRERLDEAPGGGWRVQKQDAAGFAAGVLPGMRSRAA